MGDQSRRPDGSAPVTEVFSGRPLIPDSAVDERFLVNARVCGGISAFIVATLIPAVITEVFRQGGGWPMATVILLVVSAGAAIGLGIADRYVRVLHPQTMIMASAASIAMCWAIPVAEISLPLLTLACLLTSISASAFWFSAGRYQSALIDPDSWGFLPRWAIPVAGLGGIAGLFGTNSFGSSVVFRSVAVAMALSTLFALAVPGLRHNPFSRPAVRRSSAAQRR